MPDIQRVMGALCYARRAGSTPYADLNSPAQWDDVAREFARQCCGLLGQVKAHVCCLLWFLRHNAELSYLGKLSRDYLVRHASRAARGQLCFLTAKQINRKEGGEGGGGVTREMPSTAGCRTVFYRSPCGVLSFVG